MPNLHLSVEAEYFHDIKSGKKIFEYRLKKEYWMRRLVGRSYDGIVITLGYPKKGDTEKTLYFPWRGYIEKTITHKKFGADPVEVFAIDLRGKK